MAKIKLPLGIRNNNPLNIRFSPMNNWKGQTGSNKGFCVFESLEFGYRAALVLLSNYQRKGYDTVAKIVSHWAPASENDTEAYIDYVATSVVDGLMHPIIDANTRITDFETLAQICWAMSRFECGKVDSDTYLDMRIAFEYVIKYYKYPSLCV